MHEGNLPADEEEHYRIDDLLADLGGLEQALLVWNHTCETVHLP